MRLMSISIAAAAILASGAAEAGLKVYDVDARYRAEVYRALKAVLQNGPSGATGQVSMLPAGQILVDASDDVQKQVAAVLEAVAKKAAAEPGTAAESRSVLLRYWVLFGVPGEQQAGATPAALAGVIRELVNAHGQMSFTVLDTASLSSEPGDMGTLETKTLTVTQKVLPGTDMLNASVTIDHGSRSADAPPQQSKQTLVVKIALRPGDYAVLGDSSVADDKGRKGLLAFVVNWPASR